MMQIGSTLPANNLHLFQARRASFKCSGSPLNPLNRPQVQAQNANPVTSTEETKKHLSNLEKLLQKQPPDQEPVQKESGSVPSLENKAKGLLEGLNLARVWPEMKAVEEMSPRHLNRLQRLLSKSAEYSPRNNLGSRWREYHGSRDWAGLLDPLDENLRREVVRYGEFIQAAYHCFHSDPATSADETPWPRHVVLPDKSYKVTKSLYATSSIGLPKWVDDVAPDLGWMTQRSSWIGYVAVCDDRREIQRMGRRDIVIALRGTATCLEWGENFRNLLVPMSEEKDDTEAQSKVECGFLSLFKTRGAHVESLAQSVVEEVQRLLEKYKGETLSITITGHSLGAALALLVGDELSTCSINMPPVSVFSFGGPRVGNRGFANRLNAKNVKVLRIVNSQDIITRVPGMFVSEELDKQLRGSGASAVLNVLDNSMPWAYAHVGTELKVDTKMSPFLKPNADVACCHDLEAYLHLVDGFMASNCPFRANAKRSLWKLLNEQRSNVKMLYTNKAKSLSLNMDKDTMNMSGCLPSPSS
ncbi:phospholipase A1-Ibeta2, chloroplastic-like [Olea europaea var. sylvestris]|uniref:Phospholipase A1-Ibeta2, chloroplastic n=1 Tax=Olea europaea subsp. europaea TaxID=158383 RepID=A0A8S0PDY1_OLEEU|nr:phospholipase A1-Ibeta2, chloroplastic-like [Olea europaea var. sylvestris]CAA2938936.1 phospholipase A1-Ibeta2, chloroplastic [Olea europaea subsp. europaea]